MSCFRGPKRAVLTALGLSLLLLTGGLALAPGRTALAADPWAGGPPSGALTVEIDPVTGESAATAGAPGTSAYEDACTSGFSDVDSKVDMSLHGVALMGRGAIAVGYMRSRDNDESGRREIATIVNHGSQWDRLPPLSPGDEDGLMAVASRDGAATWAVGFTIKRSRLMPQAMRWNGRSWKSDRPRIGGNLPAMLTDVTIVGGASPLAVGYRLVAGGKRKPLVMRKDGKRWITLPIKTGRNESISLNAVAIDRRGGTWVVGHGGNGAEVKPVVYRRGGGGWTRFPMPELDGEAVLTDVVAVDRKDSWAVGYHRHDGRSEALVLRFDGKRWHKVDAPGWASNEVLLSAVSADPAGGVWAVGAAWDDEYKSHEAVAAWWDGRAWNEVAGRAGGTELHDVVGSLDDDGWAVGRSGQSARATRVCTPPQAGVFGASGPLPEPGLTASIAGLGPTEAATLAGGADPAEGATAEIEDTDIELASTADVAVVDEPVGTEESSAGAAKSKPSGKTKKKPTRRAAQRMARVVRVKTGSLPPARPDKSIYAVDVARGVGLYEETSTYGAVVDDFDGDGTDDLFIGRHGRPGRLMLDRDGRYEEHEALSLASYDRHGCTSADIDGSGLPDLYCAVGGKRGSGLKANELILDPGSAEPREVAVEFGVSDPTGRGRVAAFLETSEGPGTRLVVANAPVRVDGLPSLGRTYTVRGDGQFVARARPGFEPRVGGLASQSADYDGDGREDLLLIAGGQATGSRVLTKLYRNTPRGLVDVTRKLGIRPFNEVDAELVDVNKDGKLDLVQLSETKLRISVLRRGRFKQVYQRRLTNGRAVAGGDVNGDGRNDLYIVRTHYDRNYPDVMLVNRGQGGRWSSLAIPQTGRGGGDDAVAFDHDGNGLDDFLVLNGRNGRGPIQLIAFYPRQAR